jgi:hypothetical protein
MRIPVQTMLYPLGCVALTTVLMALLLRYTAPELHLMIEQSASRT